MITFFADGHPNISSIHSNTFEFTKDSEVSTTGHCLVGVNATFDLGKLKKFLSNNEFAKMVITAGGLTEEIIFRLNKTFLDAHEIVIRKSDFLSRRTLGIKADKASSDFSKELKEKLKDPKLKIRITLEKWQENN